MLGILVDVTKCTGCEQCVSACVNTNYLDPERAEFDRATTTDGLSDHRWLTVQKVEKTRFARKSCMHCLEPSCVAACLVGAISKQESGPVIYDSSKCIGCRYCMLACPFHIPRYEWSQTIPYIKKCHLCFERLHQGNVPSCVEACPQKALAFGNRQELLEVAQKRIDEEGSSYLPHIWGKDEFGGTCVVYISDVDLSSLNWSKHFSGTIPELTETLIKSTPLIGLGVATGLLGISWIVRRRERLMNGEEGMEEDTDA